MADVSLKCLLFHSITNSMCYDDEHSSERCNRQTFVDSSMKSSRWQESPHFEIRTLLIILLLVLLIVASVLACSQVDAGLLRVPRVYNALITTNQKLVPSRAISVSAPVLQPLALSPFFVGAPHAALFDVPDFPPPASSNSSEFSPPAEDKSEPANKTSTAEPAPLTVPVALYSTYNPFSYYSPLLSYSYHHSYPFVYNSPLVHPFLHFPLVPAAGAGAEKPASDAAASGSSELPSGPKDEPEKESVSVEAN